MAIVRRMGYLGWLSCGFRWLLAAVFCLAGIPKLVAPHDFAVVISAYGLVPRVLLLPTAVLLPLLEVVAALGLVLNRRWSMGLSAGLLLLFIGVLSYGIHLGLDIDCGCFGPEDPEHTAFSGLKPALFRDLLLMVPLAYSWWFERRSPIANRKGELP